MHPFSTPWKHYKTLRFSVFRRYKGCIDNKWVDILQFWLRFLSHKSSGANRQTAIPTELEIS